MAGDENAGPDLDAGFQGLDDLIDKAFDGAEGDADELTDDEEDATEEIVTSQPEGDEDGDDEDDLEEEDEGEEDPEDEDEEDDEEDEDEDEEDEEDDDDEDDEEDEEEEEEDVLSVTATELKKIKKDPILKKLYSSMQRDYGRKTTALAERTRGVDATERAIDDFESRVKSPKGLADYLANTMANHPQVVGKAFEEVATGDKGKDFLVAVGEAHPEVFEEAHERLQEILNDDDERKRYVRERDMRSKESNLQDREDKIRRGTFDREFSTLITAAEKEAKRLGIEPDDMEGVHNRLKDRVRGKVRADGSITVRPQDAKAIAKEAKAEMDKQYEKALRSVNRKKTKESREATKKKARRSKGQKRVAPKATRRKAPTDKKKFVPEEGRDPLDSFVDHRLGT